MSAGRIRDSVHRAARLARNMALTGAGRADYRRWSSSEGLEAWWDERTERLATLVPPGCRVIEFGAGRRTLERYLHDGCTYIPSDLVDRGAGTIVLDLNARPLPDLRPHAPEVAVFGGVLEYVRDVAGVVEWLARVGIVSCVVSFDAFPSGAGVLERYRESRRRVYNGYMNRLSEAELLSCFEAAGFACIESGAWRRQALFVFGRAAK
jgi:hypothetical protein